MKIRMQILLAIAPIFLGLGLVVSLLHYQTRMGEIETDLREEGFTLAIALSEFLGSSETREWLSGGESIPSTLETALNHVMKANPIHQLSLIGAPPASGVFELGEGAGVRATLSGENWSSFSREGVLISDIIQTDSGAHVEVASTVYDSQGPFALLALRVDAANAQARQRAILLNSALFLLGILSGGLLSAWIIGYLVADSVSRLREATQIVASGRYDWRIQKGWLREFNDLGNTFSTMTSLLEEILSRTKRAVIQGEQFRRPADLADAFASQLWQVGEVRKGSILARLGRFGDQPDGGFLGVWLRNGRARVTLGRVVDSGELAKAVAGSAASALVREELELSGAGHGFERASVLFQFESWTSVCWNEGSKGVDVWQYRAAGSEGPVRRFLQIGSEEPIALHGLEGECAERLQLYLRLLRGTDPVTLVDELATLLDEPEGGGIVIVSSGL